MASWSSARDASAGAAARRRRVLNALGDGEELHRAWSDWRRGWATADGTRWTITWSPTVVARLAAWHDEGRLELQWVTTCGHDANDKVRTLLGLPRLAVAGTYQDEDADGAATGTADSHAAVAPSAPDPLSGRWWKYEVVRRVLAQQPDRLVVWVDDELQPGTAFRRWADDQPKLHPVGPDPMLGLTDDDLASMVVIMEREDA